MVGDIAKISHELNRTQEKPGTIEAFHISECLSLFEQLGFSQGSQISHLLRDGNFTKRRNKNVEAFSKLIMAKIAGHEGHYAHALNLFRSLIDHSSPLAKSTVRESGLAYLFYEYSRLLEELGDKQGAALYLERSKSHSRSNKLKHILHVEDLKQSFFKRKKSPLREWLQEIAYFAKYGMDVMEIETRLSLANYYSGSEEYAEAATQLEEGHLKAAEMGYGYLLERIDLAKVDVLVHQGRTKEAIHFLETLSARSGSSASKSEQLFQLAQLYEEAGDYESALRHAKNGEEVSLRFGVLTTHARLSLKLGRIYHRSKADITKAFFYYQKAYGSIQTLQQQEIPAQGDLEIVLAKYITFLEEHFPGAVDESANEDLFAFSRDMKWVQIKDLFHYNLFLYHYTNTGVGARTLEVLDFPASSFYSATERLRSRGITFPNFRKSKVEIPSDNYYEGLQQYCRLHRERSWVDINDRFEKDMLAYHYKLNNYNKKIMAQKLALAYSGIVNRTQYLTSRKS